MIKKQNKKQPFVTFKNERINSITEYTCTLGLALFTFIPDDGNWPLMEYSMLFFSTHKNSKPITYRLYTLTECTDIPQPATAFCTIHDSHVSTAEINTFRYVVIASIYFS
jgi:hypothetical protein